MAIVQAAIKALNYNSAQPKRATPGRAQAKQGNKQWRAAWRGECAPKKHAAQAGGLRPCVCAGKGGEGDLCHAAPILWLLSTSARIKVKWHQVTRFLSGKGISQICSYMPQSIYLKPND